MKMLVNIYFTTKEDKNGKSYEDMTMLDGETAEKIIQDYNYTNGRIDIATIILNLLPFESVEFQKELFDGFTFDEIESFECEYYPNAEWVTFDRFCDKLEASAKYNMN